MINKTTFWTHYSEESRITVVGTMIILSGDWGIDNSYKADLGARIVELLETKNVTAGDFEISITKSNRGDPYRSGFDIQIENTKTHDGVRVFLEDRDYEDFVQAVLSAFVN